MFKSASSYHSALMGSAAVLAVAGLSATSVQAQTTAAPPAPVDDTIVVVTGHSLAEKRAVELKRKSDLVSDNLSSDEFGSLPDYGLGQALKRLPGVSMVINNGRGEEQYMTIRGLSPNYNTTTIDGIQLPSTELGSTSASSSTASGRTTSYDVLPSSFAKAVNVFKSWEPDLPADAIGGVTNIVTLSPFDRPGFFADGGAKAADWQDKPRWHSNSPSGEGDLTIGDTFGPGKKFGALVSASYYRRASSSWDTVSNGTQAFYHYTGGKETLAPVTVAPSTDLDGLTNVPGQTGWLNYDDVRTRETLFGKLEYRSDGLDATLTGGFAEHILNEDRNSQYLDTSGNATLTSPDTGTYASGSASAAYDHYLINRQIEYVQADAKYQFANDVHLSLVANYAHGIYNQASVDDSFTYSGTAGSLALSYLTSTTSRALFTPNSDAGFLNPANYTLNYHQFADSHGDSRAPTFKVEAGWHDQAGADGLGYRVGAVWRDLVESGYATQERYDAPKGVTMAALGQDIYLSPYDGEGQQFLVANPANTANYYNANANLLTADASNLSASSIGNYTLEEKTLSPYGMLTYRASRLYASAGLRVESTDQSVMNYLPSSFVSSSKATSFAAQTAQSHYSKVLPAINVAYDIAKGFKLRAGASTTIARADYSQLAQNSSLTVSSVATATVPGIATQTISNPALKPRVSDNYDLSLEWYGHHDILLSAGLFDKHITEEIVTLNNIQTGVKEPGAVGVYTVTTTQSQNSGPENARGIEVDAVVPSFYFLPGYLTHFGFSGNVSLNQYDPSVIRMSDGTLRRLPGLISSTRGIENASLLFNDGPWDGRLAYNHTGRMPYSFSTSNAGLDQWYGASDVVDLQLRYHVNKQLALVFQGQNLTNNKPVRLTGPGVNIYSETLENGRSFFAGVDFKFN